MGKNSKSQGNMSLFSKIVVTSAAIEFFYIMYLETFVTASKATGRVFKMSRHTALQTLLKNQGVSMDCSVWVCCMGFIFHRY